MQYLIQAKDGSRTRVSEIKAFELKIRFGLKNIIKTNSVTVMARGDAMYAKPPPPLKYGGMRNPYAKLEAYARIRETGAIHW